MANEFARAEAEHTAAANRTSELANKREFLRRELVAFTESDNQFDESPEGQDEE